MDRQQYPQGRSDDPAQAVPAGVQIEIRRGYQPGLVGRIGELHGTYYAAAWGAGAPFETLLVRELCEFIEHYDACRDIILSAYYRGKAIGSIAVLGQPPGADDAQLRFFIVDPEHQGLGAGRRLLSCALDWCREQGYGKVFLWTVDGLPQSRRLYEKTGFAIVERLWDERYTVPRESLRMQIALD